MCVCVCVCVLGRDNGELNSTLWLSCFPGGSSGKESGSQGRRHKRHGWIPGSERSSWRRKRQPTPVSLPGKSHGQKSLAGYSLQSCQELDMTEHTKHTCGFHGC